MWTAIIIIGLIVILILWVVGIYKRLVALRNQVKNGWSQIDVQLQRRYDLIPNLVETVKGYMEFEKSTLQAVIAARNQASTTREQIQKSDAPPTGSAIKELQGAETALRGGLGQIFALAENYPQLRASETMQCLKIRGILSGLKLLIKTVVEAEISHLLLRKPSFQPETPNVRGYALKEGLVGIIYFHKKIVRRTAYLGHVL